jgi:propionyl-CoA carboxylase alpha chain
MRVVRTMAELPAGLAAARSEAAAAFGDPTVFCEPYLEAGRHLEVQILADAAGTVWTVGERECSIQRRHQKIIEEAPSPLAQRISGMRQNLLAAARAAACAVGYINAGTAEFLADDTGKFYFLEMNTRLQVEHPVTECTTGLDLVALQLQIAAGQQLLATPPKISGHAIEVRLYAEDPAVGWQPQSGTLHRFDVPGPLAEFAVPPQYGSPQYGLRLDSGVVDGSDVGTRYDPMLAKLICWGADRDQAAAALSGALARARIHGLTTNRDLLVRVLRHPAFLAGQTDTAFLDRHGLDGLAAPLADEEGAELSALAAALADAAGRRARARVLGALPSGWRNMPSAFQRKEYALAGGQGQSATRYRVGYRIERGGLVVDGRDDVRLVSMAPGLVELDVAGLLYRFDVSAYPELTCVDSVLGPVALQPVGRFADSASHAVAGSLLAPMPGTVTRIGAAAGDQVTAGQPLLWLEAMKMEHVISAPVAGIVAELPVSAGQQVEVGTVLAVVKPQEDPE